MLKQSPIPIPPMPMPQAQVNKLIATARCTYDGKVALASAKEEVDDDLKVSAVAAKDLFLPLF